MALLRDVSGLLLALIGGLTFLTGLGLTFTTAGVLPAALVTAGLSILIIAVRVGRYDPEIAAARRARRAEPPTRP